MTYLIRNPESADNRSQTLTARPIELDRGNDNVSAKVVGDGVNNPGTYKLQPDSTVRDLIKAGGGLTENALAKNIDIYQTVSDGMVLTIPTKNTLDQVQKGDKTLTNEDLIYFRTEGDDYADTEYVDINRANQRRLQTLPGIGPVLSRRIKRHRDREGRFTTKEDLKHVDGIGDVTYKQVKPHITK
ncbi:MAG: helix-hairpin-helix domain-containing protein [bacterium]